MQAPVSGLCRALSGFWISQRCLVGAPTGLVGQSCHSSKWPLVTLYSVLPGGPQRLSTTSTYRGLPQGESVLSNSHCGRAGTGLSETASTSEKAAQRPSWRARRRGSGHQVALLGSCLLRRLRQEGLKVGLGHTARPCLKAKTNNRPLNLETDPVCREKPTQGGLQCPLPFLLQPKPQAQAGAALCPYCCPLPRPSISSRCGGTRL